MKKSLHSSPRSIPALGAAGQMRTNPPGPAKRLLRRRAARRATGTDTSFHPRRPCHEDGVAQIPELLGTGHFGNARRFGQRALAQSEVAPRSSPPGTTTEPQERLLPFPAEMSTF